MVSLINAPLAEILYLDQSITAAQAAVAANLQLTNMSATTNAGTLGAYAFNVTNSALVLNAVIQAMQSESATLLEQLLALT